MAGLNEILVEILIGGEFSQLCGTSYMLSLVMNSHMNVGWLPAEERLVFTISLSLVLPFMWVVACKVAVLCLDSKRELSVQKACGKIYSSCL